MPSVASENRSARASSISSQSRSSTSTWGYQELADPCSDEDSASDSDVREFIYKTDDPENAVVVNQPPILEFEESDYGSWESAPNSKCHASFGDKGTTATVGASGQILQFSEYLGEGSSGVFSADHLSVDEPYYVLSRARDLQDMSQEPLQFKYESLTTRRYGLRFPNLIMKPDAQAQLKWVYWKWPRHECNLGSFQDYPKLKLTTQWMIREGTVLQQCILENHGEEDIQLEMEFCKSMVIRDLDHLESDHPFNIPGIKNHGIRPGPKGYSWVCVHRFTDDLPELDTNAPRDSVPLSVAHVGHPAATSSTCGDLKESTDHKDEVGPSQLPEDEHSPNDHRQSTSDPTNQQTLNPETLPRESMRGRKTPHSVAVISAVTIDGEVQIFDNNATPQKWHLMVKSRDMSVSNRQPRALEVITSYKMSVFEDKDNHWQAAVIPIKAMNINGFLREQVPLYPLSLSAPQPFHEVGRNDQENREDPMNMTQNTPRRAPVGTPGKSSPQDHLEFAMRRNLEHILSVCAIEVAPKVSDFESINSLPDSLKGDLKAVALTCGDMSGHRICWSASFFAFRFLVEVHKKISNLREQPYVKDILERIESTCLGHLKWLHLIQKQDDGQRFGPNYWVTGALMILPYLSESWIAKDSYLDTGFQILKAAASMELSLNNDVAPELMNEWAASWIISLEKADLRKKYAWPHAEDDGINTFRLDDHVWIWRALKSLENGDRHAWKLMAEKAHTQYDSKDAKYDSQSESNSSAWSEIDDISPKSLKESDIERLHKKFGSERVQREISQRFTTENDLLGKRMLAVTKSSRETRFLLHARDTALLYSEMADFLGEDTSVQELWRNTIECQEYHDGNQESNWENALRYGLCVMIGIQGLRINNRSPGELARTATEILFRSCSPNGFFPGNLELQTKKPLEELFSEEKFRDFHYHANFEISYILLTRATKLVEAYDRRAGATTAAAAFEPTANRGLAEIIGAPGSQRPQQIHQSDSDVSFLPGDPEQNHMLLRLANVLLRESKFPDQDNQEIWGNARRTAKRRRLTMKKAVPFSKLIDSSSIVKVEDEWLFKYPDFFRRTPSRKEAEAEMRDLYWDRYLAQLRSPQSRCIEFAFWVVDVPSSKLIEGKSKNRSPSYRSCETHTVLRNALRPPRTARHSKKRLLYLPAATPHVRNICASETEQSEVSNVWDFFDRHRNYEKHVLDHCNMLHNSWETEFHLSYYQLVSNHSLLRPGISLWQWEPFPGRGQHQLMRASTSFRFKGDFFDRHWTCYMVEYTHPGYPDMVKRSPENSILTWDKPSTCLNRKEHRQRKVLEQHFVADILTALNTSTKNILDEVKKGLDVKSGSFSTPIPSNTAYSSWSALWREFEPLLQTLDDDLASTKVTLDQWETREENRGEERPRWTRNDERKYRASITEHRRRIKHQRTELQQLHTSIKLLRESFSKRLAMTREELTFRDGQNIASFTYVTVVFLPLGFTASIFSMNGSPGTGLVINMVVASVAALAVTILALMNARVLTNIVENISSEFSRLTADAMKSSLMAHEKTGAESAHVDSADGRLNTVLLRKSPEDEISWNLAFWIGHIFIEVPARRIALACNALGWPPARGLPLADRVKSWEVPKLGRLLRAPRLDTTPDATPGASSRVKQLLFGHFAPVTTYLRRHQALIKRYPRRLARVLMGFLILPIFIAAWICQILLFNALDALILIGELLRKGLSAFLSNVEGSDPNLIRNLAKPSKHLRPMKELKSRLWRDEEPRPPEPGNK